jgi:hypothetical protein
MAFKVSKNGHMKPSKGGFHTFHSLRTKGNGLTQEHYEKFKDNLKDINKLDTSNNNIISQPEFMKTKKLKPKQYISFI